ncbi:MAG: hypothetical protein H7Z73_05075 [Candidatus Saccharibacteria bacterium]|nr:hypothetical protein [Moraxellaceae bacterium]
MLKKILSSALLFGLIVISAPSHAEILVNHHGQPIQESGAHLSSHQKAPYQSASHHRSVHRTLHHGRQHLQRHHYRSYTQHRDLVISCLRMKNGRHYRVC